MVESIITETAPAARSGQRTMFGIWHQLIGQPFAAFTAIRDGRSGRPRHAFLLWLAILCGCVGLMVLGSGPEPRLPAGKFLVATIALAILFVAFFVIIAVTHILMKVLAGTTNLRALFTAYAYIGTLTLLTAPLTMVVTRLGGPVAFYRATALIGIWYTVLCSLAVMALTRVSLRRAAVIALAGWGAAGLILKAAWPWLHALFAALP